MAEDQAMAVAVVGVGRMGRHHARTYASAAGAKLAGVVDMDPARARTAGQEFGCPSYGSVAELLAAQPGLRAVTVAVPTKFHRVAAEPLLQRRIACLVEKPLAATLDEARALADFAHRHGALLQVGHTERFNPAVRALLALKMPPLYVEAQRVSPLTFRSMDVGVVMDMMIHDLDIVLAMAQSPLKRVDAVGFPVVGGHEDIANAVLTFESGCVANLTASRLALRAERKLKVIGATAYITVDYRKRKGLVIRKSDDAAQVAWLREQVDKGADLTHMDYSRFVKVDRLRMGDGSSPRFAADPLAAELASFLDAVRNGAKPEVDGAAGCAAVDAAERILRAIQSHRIAGLPDKVF
jgi:predicted dehydrogenase